MDVKHTSPERHTTLPSSSARIALRALWFSFPRNAIGMLPPIAKVVFVLHHHSIPVLLRIIDIL